MLDPCSSLVLTGPCSEAIKKAGIRRVVIGALDPNPKHSGAGVELLREAGIEVTVGVERNACSEINQPFFCWITTGRPLVILKMAMTLDGKIATAEGESKWITGPEARRRVQQLRRLADAVMVGGETVRRDHPAQPVREPASWPCQQQRQLASRSKDEEAQAENFPELMKGSGRSCRMKKEALFALLS